MRRRTLKKVHWNSSAIRLLQRINKAAVAILEILMDNFDLTIQLNVLARIPLQLDGCCLRIAVVGSFRVVSEKNCAAEKNDDCKDGIYGDEDPGADP